MPVKAHVNNDLDYRGSTTHHNWKHETHHNWNHDNHHMLIYFGLGAIIVILLIVLSMAA